MFIVIKTKRASNPAGVDALFSIDLSGSYYSFIKRSV